MRNSDTIHPDKATDLPLIIHIPHSSAVIPAADQINYLYPKEEIEDEINKLNDHFTDILFASNLGNAQTLIFPVNRFLVDVERFENDQFEPMALKGMGALYTHDTRGKRFRNELNFEAREYLLNKYYRPHHSRLAKLTLQALSGSGRVLIIDGHSFPDQPLPCDQNQELDRPDICLGTDAFHTPAWLIDSVKAHFENYDLSVTIDRPYSGTMVPSVSYQMEPRVWSIMIEINRKLYLDSNHQRLNPNFEALKSCIAGMYETIIREAASRVSPTVSSDTMLNR